MNNNNASNFNSFPLVQIGDRSIVQLPGLVKARTEAMAKRFINQVMEPWSDAERSMVLWNTNEERVLTVTAAVNDDFNPDGRDWARVAFFAAMGGVLPSYAKGRTLYVPKNLVEAGGFLGLAKKAPGFKAITFNDTANLGEGDICLVDHYNKTQFDLPRKHWVKLKEQLVQAGVEFVTIGDLLQDFMTEVELGETGFEIFVRNLGYKIEKAPQFTKVYGQGWTRVKFKWGNFHFRLDQGTLELLFGTKHYEIRKDFMLSGVPTRDAYVMYAALLTELMTARSLQAAEGRMVFMTEAYVDDIYVGKAHDLLLANKAGKVANMVVVSAKDAYTPMFYKGKIQHLIQGARRYHEMNVPTFLNKAAKWLLVGDGARSAGVDLKDNKVTYMTSVDKTSKLLGRYLHGVPTADAPNLCESGIKLLFNGKEHTWKGVPIMVARVQSPIVEEGSGNAPANPYDEMVFAQNITHHDSIPGSLTGEEATRAQTILPEVGKIVQPYEALISLKEMKIGEDGKAVLTGNTIVRKRNGRLPGQVLKVIPIWDAGSKTLHVKVLIKEASSSTAQKYRGVNKYRVNTFERDIFLKEGNDTIFDPTKPRDEVNYVQHLVGDEEGKTMTQIIEMAAHQIGAVWNGHSWENEDAILTWIKDNAKSVTVVRNNIEPTVYSLLKAKFQGDTDFTFKDNTRSITHKNAQAWVGTVTQIIEVPLTETFVGKTTLFGEVLGYLGIQYPKLYNLLIKGTLKNCLAAEKLYDMGAQVHVLSDTYPNDPFILVGPNGTMVEWGTEMKLDILPMTEEDLIFIGVNPENAGVLAAAQKLLKISRIVLPQEDPGLQTLRSIQTGLKAWNKKLAAANINIKFNGVHIAARNAHSVRTIHIIPSALARMVGSLDNNITQSFLRVLSLLGVDTGFTQAKVEGYRTKYGWESAAYRYVSLLKGSIEKMAYESNAVMAKIAKTEKVAFMARVATTISGRVALTEVWMNPTFAAQLTHSEGDILLVGRNPMPKMGALQLRLDDNVPHNVIMLNALTWHSINEGDADGDEAFWLTVTPEGDVLLPTLTGGKRSTIKGSPEIRQEVERQVGPLNNAGYWTARGLDKPALDAATLLKVPYHEFHENNSHESSKKNLLGKAYSLAMEPKDDFEVEAFFRGTILTQGTTIPNGFFLYSAVEVAFKQALCKYSRQFNVPAEKQAIVDAAKGAKDAQALVNLHSLDTALEICARLLYEGAGSLGGYKDQVWLLWGRLKGIGCPTNAELLSPEDAAETAAAYAKAGNTEKYRMFRTWFQEAYGAEFLGADDSWEAGMKDLVLKHIHQAYEACEWYKKFERGEIKEDDVFLLSPEEFIQVVPKLVTGIYRRVNKGLTESAGLEYLDAQHLTWVTTKIEEDGQSIFINAISAIFSDYSGGLSVFGRWLLSVIAVSNARIELYHGFNSRMKHEHKNNKQMAIEGLVGAPIKHKKAE